MSLNEDNEYPMKNLDNANERDDPAKESSIDSNKDYGTSNEYNFGWNRYSEITNGRFAMVGFLAIIIIEVLSKKSFFSWAGILN